MLNKFKTSVILSLVLAIMLSIGVVFPAAEVNAASTYSGTVDYVKDGDTIYLRQPVAGTRQIRFLGIDTPETFTVDGKDPGNQVDPYGNAAKAYLKNLLPSGTKITLVTDVVEKDAFDRLLAYVYKGTLDVNKDLVEKGYAETYVIWPNSHDSERYESLRNAMISARNNGLGIWNSSNPLQERPFEYRDRMFDEVQDKYVGDFYTKKYVDPADYKLIKIEDQVFFFSEQDAINAGYSHQ
ncbi:thermonuclease family protein [Cohnella sp.]|uniref:thermonuclease family protein n=1 Tax=Cohnella sp. TaxID=1883426 RepID=UPI003564D202